MTGDGRAGWDLTEAEAREIITKRLEWVHSQRKTEIFALLLPVGLAWMSYFPYVSVVDHSFLLNPALLISIGITVLCLFLFVLMTTLINRYRAELRQVITQMTDAEREKLLPGLSTEFQNITNHVPRPFRKRFPSAKYPLFLSEQAPLVARNLDWYLAGPRRLVRFSWISAYVVILVLMFLFGCEFYLVLQTNQPEYSLTSIGYFLVYISLQLCIFVPIGERYEAIRIEVYRDFVLDWFRRHPVDDEG